MHMRQNEIQRQYRTYQILRLHQFADRYIRTSIPCSIYCSETRYFTAHTQDFVSTLYNIPQNIILSQYKTPAHQRIGGRVFCMFN